MRRSPWKEFKFTVYMFSAGAAMLYAADHGQRWPGIVAALSTTYWWLRAGDEGSKP